MENQKEQNDKIQKEVNKDTEGCGMDYGDRETKEKFDLEEKKSS